MTVAVSAVRESVTDQYRNEAKGVKHDEDFILKQKYGLVFPQLTTTENALIRKEAF